MSSSSSSSTFEMSEDGVQAIFNEVDPLDDSGSVLRTLVDFELTDQKGNLISLDDIGEGKRTAKAVGYVLEPLSSEWRETLMKFVSTSEQTKTVAAVVKGSLQKKQAPLLTGDADGAGHASMEVVDASMPFDRTQIKVGDLLDGYCIKTFKWYSAKVTEMKEESDGTKMVKIHFSGWASRHDEWIEQLSERLVAAGSSKELMREAAKKFSEMLPWFESDRLNYKVESVLGPHKHRAKQAITIPCIEDWCIDLTYCNPSVWLISSTGVWYRVAGPLCPNGVNGSPTKRYSEIFSAVNKKFLIVSHVAMCLLDYFPTTPKITLEAVIDEINSRTKGTITPMDIFPNYELICTSISSMSQPDDWDKRLGTFGKSVFIQQLKTAGMSFAASSKKLSSNQNASRSTGDLSVVSEGDGKDGQSDAPLKKKRKSVAKSSSVGDPADNDNEGDGQSSSKYVKYPVDDKELWAMERQKISVSGATGAREPPPFPKPSPSSRQLPYSSASIGDMLSSYASYLNFRHELNLPHLALEEFEALLHPTEDLTHPLIVDLHVALLAKILVDREAAPFVLTIDGDSQVFEVHALSSMWHRPVEDGPKLPSEEQLKQFLRTGDTWVEILRLLTAEKKKALIPEYHDPLSTCLNLVSLLMHQSDAAPFCQPVELGRDKVPGYEEVVTHPMDLGTIRKRIVSGWYDPQISSSSLSSSSSSSSSTKVAAQNSKNIPLEEGDLRDVYSTEMKRWCQAKVISVDHRKRTVLFRLKHLGDKHDQLVAYDIEPYIAPKGSLSKYPTQPREVWLAALEARKKQPEVIQAKRTTRQSRLQEEESTQHCGHVGVLEDVRLIWANCLQYNEKVNPSLCDQAISLSEKFEAGFERRVTATVETGSGLKVAPKAGQSEDLTKLWQSCVSLFGSTLCYNALPVETKLLCLTFIFDEFCASSAGRKYLDEVIEVARFNDKEERAVKSSNRSHKKAQNLNGSRDEDDDAGSIDEPVKDSRANANLTMEQWSNRRGYKRMNITDQATMSNISPERAELLRHRDIRLAPLGRGDRDDRLYWALTSPSPETDDGDIPRIFVEDQQRGTWHIFSTADDLNRLISWLEPKGRRENKTRDAIRHWMRLNNVQCTVSSSAAYLGKIGAKKGKSDEMDADGDSEYTGKKSAKASKKRKPLSSSKDEEDDFDAGMRDGDGDMRQELDAGKLEAAERLSVVSQEQQARNISLGVNYNHCNEFWSINEKKPLAFAFKVRLTPTQHSLGLGFRDVSGSSWVIAISPGSLGHGAGFKVGDRVVRIGDIANPTPLNLKEEALKAVEQVQRSKQAVDVEFLVLRFPDPFADLTEKDIKTSNLTNSIVAYTAEMSKWVTSSLEEHAQVVTKDPLSLHPLVDQFVGGHSMPSHLAGAVLHLLDKAIHPYITDAYWAASSGQDCITSIFSQMKTLRDYLASGKKTQLAELTTQLVRVLCDAMISLDGALNEWTKRIVWKDNGPFRLRPAWRKSCAEAQTLAQASLCISTLQYALRVDGCKEVCKQWDKRGTDKIMAHPHFARQACLHEGATVVYYGDGHVQAEAREAKYKAPKMWGASLAAPFPGQVFECRVTNVRLFKCGESYEATKKCFPFAQIDLLILPPTIPKLFPAPSVGLKLHPKATFHRILGRIIAAVGSMTDAGNFQTSVAKAEQHQYVREVRGDQIFLNDIRYKIQKRLYNHQSEMMEDFMVMRTNMESFYKSRNADMIAMCDVMLDEMQALLEIHKPDFDAALAEEAIVDPKTDEILARKDDVFLKLTQEAEASAIAVRYGVGFGGGMILDDVKKPPSQVTTSTNKKRKSTDGAGADGSDSEGEREKPAGAPVVTVSSASSAEVPQGSAKYGIVVEGKTPTVGQSFTICYRIGAPRQFPEFFVAKEDFERVSKGNNFNLDEVYQHGVCTSEGKIDRQCGYLIGSRPLRPDGFLPWDWLQVEWEDGKQSGSEYVNPWEVTESLLPFRKLETRSTNKMRKEKVICVPDDLSEDLKSDSIFNETI